MTKMARWWACVLAGTTMCAAEICSIGGRVTDDRGAPVKWRAVNAIRETLEPGNRVFGAVTNERGEYCINVMPGGTALPPGRYRVTANRAGNARAASPSCAECCEPATDLVATDAPGPSGLVTVVPAQPVAGVNIRLRRSAVFCVRGVLAAPPGASVHLALESEGVTTGIPIENGRFLLTNLQPGEYTVTVLDRPRMGRALGQRRFVVRNRNVDGLVVRVPR